MSSFLFTPRHWLKTVTKPIQRAWLHLPGSCTLCAAVCQARWGLCQSCYRALPRPLETSIGEPVNPLGPDELVAGLSYEYPVDHLLRSFKYGGGLHLGAILSQSLLDALLIPSVSRPDYLVPVPLSPQRQRQRGYNQAREIALRVGTALKIPLIEHGLRRVRHTSPQAGMNAAQRSRNLEQAFALARDFIPPAPHVGIIDDVYTTGATVGTLSQLLRQHGIQRVSAWVIARTPAPDFSLARKAFHLEENGGIR